MRLWGPLTAQCCVPPTSSRKMLPVSPTSRTYMAKRFVNVLALVCLINYSGVAASAASTLDVVVNAGWRLHVTGIYLLSSLVAAYWGGRLATGADPLALAKTQLMKGGARREEKEFSHLVVPGASVGGAHRDVAALGWSSTKTTNYASGSLIPVFLLGAFAAEAPKNPDDAAFSATPPDARPSPARTSVLATEEGQAGVGPRMRESQSECSAAFPKNQQHRSGSLKASSSLSADPLCHMSDVAIAPGGPHVEERLRHGTEEEKLQAVRELSRMHVTTWNHLSVDELHAERLPGGLSNQLYVVQVRQPVHQPRGGKLPDNGEQSVTPGKKKEQEAGQAGKQLSQHAEGARECEESRRCCGESVDDGETAETGVSAAPLQTYSIRPHKVLFRVFGQPDSMQLFDPLQERELFRHLSRSGLAPRCFAEFSTGRIEGWIDGAALHVDELQRPHIQEGIAALLTKLHSTHVDWRPLSIPQGRSTCRWRQVLPSFPVARSSRVRLHEQLHRWQLLPREALQSEAQLEETQQQQQPPEQHQQQQEDAEQAKQHHRYEGRRKQQEAPTLGLSEASPAYVPHRDCRSPSPERRHRHSAAATRACTCSLCRGRDWAALADVAAAKMKAAAARAEAVAEAVAPAVSVCFAAGLSAGDAAGTRTSAATEQQAQEAALRGRTEVQKFRRSEAGAATAKQVPASEKPPAAGPGEVAEESAGGFSAGAGGVLERQGKREPKDMAAACEKYDAVVTAAREIRASVEAYRLLDLEKYQAELSFISKAVQRQILQERAPGELERVYGSVDNWLLLSGGSPVLSHNDLQENNIMSTREGLELIDFEYSGENVRAADLGNFFCEMTVNYTDLHEYPYFFVDPSKFPSPAIRRFLISKYLKAVVLERLEEEEKHQGAARLSLAEKEGIANFLVNEDVIANFEVMTKLSVLASHLVWAFWSVVKAPVPPPPHEFDYLEYARQRLKLYDVHKEEFFPNGVTSSVSLRH